MTVAHSPAGTLRTRVHILAGQVEALERALAREAAAEDILVQIAAVRGAAQALMLQVLDERLRDEVVGEEDAARRAARAERLLQLLRGYAR